MTITGTKQFVAGDTLAADDVNQYLMRGIKVYATATVRNDAYGGAGEPVLEEGETCYVADVDQVQVYNGSAWVSVSSRYAGTVASASSIAVNGSGIYLLTGTTGVSTVTGGTTGAQITIVASGQAAGAMVVLNHGTGSNNMALRDSANFGLYAGESVTFVYDGTKWVETGRNFRQLIAVNSRTTDYTVTNSYAQALAGSAITYDGATPVIIEFATSRVRASGTGTVELSIYDVTTSVGIVGTVENGNVNGASCPVVCRFRLTPAAGSHTYNLYAIYTTAAGTVYAGAGGVATVMPATLRVYRDL